MILDFSNLVELPIDSRRFADEHNPVVDNWASNAPGRIDSRTKTVDRPKPIREMKTARVIDKPFEISMNINFFLGGH